MLIFTMESIWRKCRYQVWH